MRLDDFTWMEWFIIFWMVLIVAALIFPDEEPNIWEGNLDGIVWRFCDGRGAAKFDSCLNERLREGECLLVLVAGDIPAMMEIFEPPTGCLVVAPEISPETY